jgi:hypothetical protein
MNRKTLANLLIVLGVLAWVPFLYLVATGREPSIFPYLTVHLIGVIGGSQLRRKSSPSEKKRYRRQVAGRILILLGVFAWAPYLYQKNILAQSVEMAPFLTVHLFGVLGGIALLLSVLLSQYWQRNHQPADQVADVPILPAEDVR